MRKVIDASVNTAKNIYSLVFDDGEILRLGGTEKVEEWLDKNGYGDATITHLNQLIGLTEK